MKTYIHWLLPLLFIGLTSCGEESQEQTVTEQVERSEQKQNIFSNKEKIEEIFGGNVDMKPIEFQKLKILLPTQLSDMKRVSSKGNSIDQFGMKFSEAKAEYRSKDRYRRLTIKITDTIAAPLMKLGLSWISGQMENESDNSYEKTITYNGHKGLEAYNRQYQKGKLHWIVDDRYLVELRGRNLSIEMIKKFGEQINFDQLNSPDKELEKSDLSDEKSITQSTSVPSSAVPAITASKVAAGLVHACKIKTDGTLSCWGGNDFGQINAPDGNFTQISAGALHNCAIKKDYTLVCWGLNNLGQTESPDGNFIQVSAGGALTCAIKSDRSLVCWGDASATNSPAGTFTQVSAGESHGCALRTDGKLSCWGDNSLGQLEAPKGIFTQVSSGGGNSCGIRHDRKLICWGKGLETFGAAFKKKSKDQDIWKAGPPSGNFSQVSVGTYNSCAIKVNGMLECWGLNLGKMGPPKVAFTQVSVGMGQICGVRVEGITACWGHPVAVSKPVSNATPDKIAAPLETLASLDSGFAATKHICGLKSDGTLSCWGKNEYEESTPPEGQYTQVSAGGGYSCGIKTDRTLICWGNNDVGQANPPEGPFKQVSASGSTTCGIRSDGTIVCWGVRNPETMPPQGIFDQISTGSGSGHSCAIKPGGDLVCWGKGLTGLANPPDGVYSQVSMGVFHNCAIKVDGTIACWGDDCCGETIPPDGTFVQISTGYNHTCGLMTDGIVKCWGTEPQINPPTERFTQIRAGAFFTCGIKIDGQLACWGSSADSVSNPRANK